MSAIIITLKLLGLREQEHYHGKQKIGKNELKETPKKRLSSFTKQGK